MMIALRKKALKWLGIDSDKVVESQHALTKLNSELAKITSRYETIIDTLIKKLDQYDEQFKDLETSKHVDKYQLQRDLTESKKSLAECEAYLSLIHHRDGLVDKPGLPTSEDLQTALDRARKVLGHGQN